MSALPNYATKPIRWPVFSDLGYAVRYRLSWMVTAYPPGSVKVKVRPKALSKGAVMIGMSAARESCSAWASLACNYSATPTPGLAPQGRGLPSRLTPEAQSRLLLADLTSCAHALTDVSEPWQGE